MAAILSQYLWRDDWEAVHEKTAVEVEDLVRSMRGAYVKTAQLLSTAFPESLPEAWVRRLERLTDDAPARPWHVAKSVLEKELSRSIESTFESFDREPVAAASVGQVHRAKIEGHDVAVKIMFPGVKQLILSDLSNIRRVLRVIKPALLPAVDEFRERVKGEFDYEQEMVAMERVRGYLQDNTNLNVVVPGIFPELTTKRVLVMDWLDGGSLRENIRRDGQRVLASSSSLSRWIGLYRLRRKAKTALDVVAQAQAAMIFGDGAFSCDPHPGNVLLVRRRVVGLIDFGNFKVFTDEERFRIAALYCALQNRDDDAIVKAMYHIGFRSKNMDPDFVVTFATQCFDRDVVDASPYQLLQTLEANDKLISLPHGYMLVARVSLLIRGLGRKLGYDQLSCAHLWRHDARRCRDLLSPSTAQ